jgi:uncharacterized protein (DUF305 family)
MHAKHYVHLAVMIVLSFIAMYILMYSMVDQFANVYNSVNQFYMAGLMTAPMVLIELAVMREMYKNPKINAVVIALSLIALVGFFAAIRQQAAVGDSQFLRSMISHHAGAVLMCNQAPIAREEVKKLCQSIVTSQKQEIDLMKKLLGSN